MEEFLKLAVNYGLGIFFAVGIAVVFFLYAREKDRESHDREIALMDFIKEHSLATKQLVKDNIASQQDIARYQRQEHESIIGTLGLLKDSINSLNNNIINMRKV